MTNFHFRLQYDVVTLHSEEAAVVAGDPYRETAVGGSCSVPCSRITALECCADSGVIANKAEMINLKLGGTALTCTMGVPA